MQQQYHSMSEPTMFQSIYAKNTQSSVYAHK